MSERPRPAETTTAGGCALMLWLVGGLVLCVALGQWVGTKLYVEPTCDTACAAQGTTYDHLWVGGRGRGESACVCADGQRSPIFIDWIIGLSVAAGLLTVYGGAAWWSRRRG